MHPDLEAEVSEIAVIGDGSESDDTVHASGVTTAGLAGCGVSPVSEGVVQTIETEAGIFEADDVTNTTTHSSDDTFFDYDELEDRSDDTFFEYDELGNAASFPPLVAQTPQ